MAPTASPLRCDIVIGTRPEAIKLAPVIHALRNELCHFAPRVVSSGHSGQIDALFATE
jgi:UDP-N-acetylglucosamine 2-epimerase